LILGAKEQNMCEFHTRCKRAKHVWISYWVQKSKTCDLNFHIGCKRASLRNLSTNRVDFALEEVKEQDWFQGVQCYGMCVPSCHNECATSAGLHSKACFSLL
jgi:hypothetical protein